MSLYDKSSLLQVPSLYKDGTLVSTIPEDRSGDFTVVRGSNLSATRIGPDGYIKKGYENLLLQSNQFDTTWTTSNASVTSGQAGYDGTNDAWKLESTANTNTAFIRQFVSASNVQTISFYAKAGTQQYIRLVLLYAPYPLIYVDLSNGSVGSSSNEIDYNVESAGDGWYRISLTADLITYGVQISISDGINSLNCSVGDNIYIQDAQLNQGLVAYPYLETTTAPAQGGLLENTPRLDWSNGVPSVLVEEGSTNLIRNSEYFDGIGWNYQANAMDVVENNSIVSPEGLKNATKIERTAVRNYTNFYVDLYATLGATYTYSVYMKAGTHDIGFLSFYLFGSTAYSASYDLTNGETNSLEGDAISSMEPVGDDWWRCVLSGFTPPDTDLFGRVGIGMSYTTSIPNWVPSNGGAGLYMHYYGAQLEQASIPSSYIPTYATTQTRSSEVISDDFNIPTTATIYNSFYSDVAETVFVFDQVFNVVEGLNKVAIAFSPTAVKISVGGSIVANATGTYDTTSLTNIQLGSNNGTDYSNAPISGFYVFPEFLTDEELNSLTD